VTLDKSFGVVKYPALRAFKRCSVLLMVAIAVSPWFHPKTRNRRAPAGRPGPLHLRRSMVHDDARTMRACCKSLLVAALRRVRTGERIVSPPEEPTPGGRDSQRSETEARCGGRSTFCTFLGPLARLAHRCAPRGRLVPVLVSQAWHSECAPPKPAQGATSPACPHERGCEVWFPASRHALGRAPRQCVTYNSIIQYHLCGVGQQARATPAFQRPGAGGERGELTDGQIADVARRTVFSSEDANSRRLGLGVSAF